jgi:hypothetical protein
MIVVVIVVIVIVVVVIVIVIVIIIIIIPSGMTPCGLLQCSAFSSVVFLNFSSP